MNDNLESTRLMTFIARTTLREPTSAWPAFMRAQLAESAHSARLEIRNLASIGYPLERALVESGTFQSEQWKPFVDLMLLSLSKPWDGHRAWLKWIEGDAPAKWSDGDHWKRVTAILERLPVALLSASSPRILLESSALIKQRYPNITLIATCESSSQLLTNGRFALLGKSLFLEIDESSKGRPFIARIGEWSAASAVISPMITDLLTLQRGLKLAPTGYISAHESA